MPWLRERYLLRRPSSTNALPLASPRLASQAVQHALEQAAPATDSILHPDWELLDSASAAAVAASATAESLTPWAQAAEAAQFASLQYHEHEQWDCPIAHIAVVSTRTPDPTAELRRQCSSGSLPAPFKSQAYNPELPRYYLLLHDEAGDAPASESERAVFTNPEGFLRVMKEHYPPEHVVLIRINSGPPTEPQAMPEPAASLWGSSLPPDSRWHLSPANVAELRQAVERLVFSQLLPAVSRRIAAQVAHINTHRRGLRNTLKSWWRKPKPDAASSRTGAGAAGAGAGRVDVAALSPDVLGDAAVPFPHTSLEMQIRATADLCFLFGDWPTAATHYRLAATDFEAEGAHVYAAAAYEGLAIALALTGALRDAEDAIRRCCAEYSAAANSRTAWLQRAGGDARLTKRAEANGRASCIWFLCRAVTRYARIIMLGNGRHAHAAVKLLAAAQWSRNTPIAPVLRERAAWASLLCNTCTNRTLAAGSALAAAKQARPQIRQAALYAAAAATSYLACSPSLPLQAAWLWRRTAAVWSRQGWSDPLAAQAPMLLSGLAQHEELLSGMRSWVLRAAAPAPEPSIAPTSAHALACATTVEGQGGQLRRSQQLMPRLQAEIGHALAGRVAPSIHHDVLALRDAAATLMVAKNVERPALSRDGREVLLLCPPCVAPLVERVYLAEPAWAGPVAQTVPAHILPEQAEWRCPPGSDVELPVDAADAQVLHRAQAWGSAAEEWREQALSSTRGAMPGIARAAWHQAASHWRAPAGRVALLRVHLQNPHAHGMCMKSLQPVWRIAATSAACGDVSAPCPAPLDSADEQQTYAGWAPGLETGPRSAKGIPECSAGLRIWSNPRHVTVPPLGSAAVELPLCLRACDAGVLEFAGLSWVDATGTRVAAPCNVTPAKLMASTTQRAQGARQPGPGLSVEPVLGAGAAVLQCELRACSATGDLQSLPAGLLPGQLLQLAVRVANVGAHELSHLQLRVHGHGAAWCVGPVPGDVSADHCWLLDPVSGQAPGGVGADVWRLPAARIAPGAQDTSSWSIVLGMAGTCPIDTDTLVAELWCQGQLLSRWAQPLQILPVLHASGRLRGTGMPSSSQGSARLRCSAAPEAVQAGIERLRLDSVFSAGRAQLSGELASTLTSPVWHPGQTWSAAMCAQRVSEPVVCVHTFEHSQPKQAAVPSQLAKWQLLLVQMHRFDLLQAGLWAGACESAANRRALLAEDHLPPTLRSIREAARAAAHEQPGSSVAGPARGTAQEQPVAPWERALQAWQVETVLFAVLTCDSGPVCVLPAPLHASCAAQGTGPSLLACQRVLSVVCPTLWALPTGAPVSPGLDAAVHASSSTGLRFELSAPSEVALQLWSSKARAAIRHDLEDVMQLQQAGQSEEAAAIKCGTPRPGGSGATSVTIGGKPGMSDGHQRTTVFPINVRISGGKPGSVQRVTLLLGAAPAGCPFAWLGSRRVELRLQGSRPLDLQLWGAMNSAGSVDVHQCVQLVQPGSSSSAQYCSNSCTVQAQLAGADV